MDAHPHPYGGASWPWLGVQPLLRLERGSDRRWRTRERHEEAVALGRHLVARRPRDRVAQQLLVALQDCRPLPTQLLGQPGRALDITEEERDGPGWQPRRDHDCVCAPPDVVDTDSIRGLQSPPQSRSIGGRESVSRSGPVWRPYRDSARIENVSMKLSDTPAPLEVNDLLVGNADRPVHVHDLPAPVLAVDDRR